jgi:hypothetical protein
MPLWFVAGTVLGETLIGVEIRKVTRQRRAAHQIHALVNRAFLARDLVNSGSSYHRQRRLTVGGRERENRSGSVCAYSRTRRTAHGNVSGIASTSE